MPLATRRRVKSRGSGRNDRLTARPQYVEAKRGDDFDSAIGAQNEVGPSAAVGIGVRAVKEVGIAVHFIVGCEPFEPQSAPARQRTSGLRR